MNRLKKLRNEKGQGLVEFALVLPIFLLVCFGIIDFSWIMHQYITFNHAARQAEWNVKIDDPGGAASTDNVTVTDNSVAVLISAEMADDSPTLQTSDLTVSNPSVGIRSQNQDYGVPGADGSTIKNGRNYRLIRVKADLSYKVPLLTPVAKMLLPSGLTLSKHIDKERILTFNDKVK